MKPWQRIVCPVDFSASSARVLAVAAHVARGEGARLTILHVTDAHGAAPVNDTVRESALAELERLAAPLRADGHTVETAFAAGPVVPAILRAVNQLSADLVVLGTHGRTGLAHALLGSVAERVLRGCPVPVLTVRQPVDDEARATTAEELLAAERDG